MGIFKALKNRANKEVKYSKNVKDDLYENNNMVRMYHPAVTEKEINEIEERFGFKYPEELRKHLLHYNGAEFEKKYLIIDIDHVESINFLTIGCDKYNKNFGALGREILKGEDEFKKVFSWMAPFSASHHPWGYDVEKVYGCSNRENELGAVYKCEIFKDRIETKLLAYSLTELMNKLVDEQELKKWQEETKGARCKLEEEEFEKKFQEEEFEASVLINSDIVQIQKLSLYPNIESVHSLLGVIAGAIKYNNGEKAVIEDISLEMLILPEERTKYEEIFKEDSILKLKLKKHKKSKEELKLMRNIFMISEILEDNLEDKELEEALEESRREVIYSDDVLGEFKLNKKYSYFEGKMKYEDSFIELIVNCESRYEIEDVENMVNILRKVASDIDKYDKEIRNFGAEKVIDEKNEYYLEEGEKKLTAKKYAEKVILESISIDADEELEFWYRDGEDSYGICSLWVRWTLNNGAVDAGIQG